MQPNFAKAMLGGLVGTAVMTMMMYYVAPIMLGQPMDIAAMLGGMTGLGWWGGMLIHFGLGTIAFPLIYAAALYPTLPGAPWVKGLTWGLVLWLVAEAFVMPMAGAGFFHSQAGGMMAVIASMMGHAVYGILLGAIAGPAISTAPAPDRVENREHVHL